MRIVYGDLGKLRRDVIKLVNEGRVRIWWWHIKPLHRVTRGEIINALLYGTPPKPDKETRGRYVTWSRLTEDRKLLRVVFEVQKVDGELVAVVTAFREEG